jgi:hypothetical protein
VERLRSSAKVASSGEPETKLTPPPPLQSFFGSSLCKYFLSDFATLGSWLPGLQSEDKLAGEEPLTSSKVAMGNF